MSRASLFIDSRWCDSSHPTVGKLPYVVSVFLLFFFATTDQPEGFISGDLEYVGNEVPCLGQSMVFANDPNEDRLEYIFSVVQRTKHRL